MERQNTSTRSIAVILLFISLYGCVNPFAPEIKSGKYSSSLIITDQQNPDEVLTNFSYAYNFKDSLVYSDLLDSSFLFISKNYATDPVTDLTWGRDVDIRTTVGLFRHFQNINLVWGGTIFQYYFQDSTEAEIKRTFQLTLNGGVEIPPINGEALFNFAKKSSGIWKITRWEDLSTF
ncbi:MAG: hypothetical protein AB7T22_05085 [Calditrichaceae bacterium]